VTTTAAAPTSVGCVLFTDLVGFTAYTEVVGDEKAVDVLDVQTALTCAVLEHWPDTRVVKELGDGLLIWCGTPDGGIGLAVELLRALGGAPAEELPLAVRMGMHHGPVTSRGDDLVGHTVNVAARITDLAGPGELVVSEDVVTSCAEEIELELQPVGPTTVKGVSAAVWLYRVAI
jgi:adenylate cyclase